MYVCVGLKITNLQNIIATKGLHTFVSSDALEQ